MRWQPWTPAEVAERLDGVDVPWYVAGGWAIDLFLGEQRRAHDDLEIGVPADQFALIRDALPGQWHVPTPAGELPLGDEQLTHGHQTWLLDPTADAWRLDVFREPAREGRWVCRRDAAITRTYDELIAHTADGVPYARPEIVLLFKAKHARPKDLDDLRAALPEMDAPARGWLQARIHDLHPGHPWLLEIWAATSR